MKTIIAGLCLAAAILLAGNSQVQAQQFVTPEYWHFCMTQAERNACLVRNAQSQVGYFGGECKPWVQNLVKATCGVWIPQNAPIVNPYYWVMPASYVSTRSGFVPGCIIQMQVPNAVTHLLGPHTAIVETVTSTGLSLIDSNWTGGKMIARHFVRYDDFNRWTQSYYYSVYIVQ